MDRVREWKPGDVALLPNGYLAVVDEQNRFVYGVGNYRNALPGSIAAKGATPLVVIDPEDADDRDALAKALVEAMHAAGDARSAAAGVHPATVGVALREFANPTPPIEEPTNPAERVWAGDSWWAAIAVDGSRRWVTDGGVAITWSDLLRDHPDLSIGERP